MASDSAANGPEGPSNATRSRYHPEDGTRCTQTVNFHEKAEEAGDQAQIAAIMPVL